MANDGEDESFLKDLLALQSIVDRVENRKTDFSN